MCVAIHLLGIIDFSSFLRISVYIPEELTSKLLRVMCCGIIKGIDFISPNLLNFSNILQVCLVSKWLFLFLFFIKMLWM